MILKTPDPTLIIQANARRSANSYIDGMVKYHLQDIVALVDEIFEAEKG